MQTRRSRHHGRYADSVQCVIRLPDLTTLTLIADGQTLASDFIDQGKHDIDLEKRRVNMKRDEKRGVCVCLGRGEKAGRTRRLNQYILGCFRSKFFYLHRSLCHLSSHGKLLLWPLSMGCKGIPSFASAWMYDHYNDYLW